MTLSPIRLSSTETREGFSHQKALHRCHGGKNTPLYRWIAGRENGERNIPLWVDTENADGKTDRKVYERHYEEVAPSAEEQGQYLPDFPKILQGFIQAQYLEKNGGVAETKRICALIAEYGLTHEMVPNEFLKSPDVWVALLEKMPITATLRNLGRMSALGLLEPFSENVQTVLDKFTPESVKKARLHPLATLIGSKTYGSGEGAKGSLTWQPNPNILSHLEDVFYWGFEAIEPTGKNILLALDCSGSMFRNWGNPPFANCPTLTCAEIAGVMAMVTARTEQNYHLTGFGTDIRDLPITSKSSLREVMAVLRGKHVWRYGLRDSDSPRTTARVEHHRRLRDLHRQRHMGRTGTPENGSGAVSTEKWQRHTACVCLHARERYHDCGRFGALDV